MFWRRGREQPESAPTDQQLLRALLDQKSEDAMAELYRRHGGLVYRFTQRLIQNESISEEVTQDVFLALLQHAGRFDADRASLGTWLCGIARRLVWKQLRTRDRTLALPPDEDLEVLESPSDEPFVTVSRQQAVLAVEQGLDELLPAFREVIVLCELEEMSYQDASEIIGVPVGTIRSRLHRAKQRLAVLLNPEPARTKNKEDGQ